MASAERFRISKDHFNQMKDSLCVKTFHQSIPRTLADSQPCSSDDSNPPAEVVTSQGFLKKDSSSVIIYRQHCTVFETSVGGGEKSKGVDPIQAGLLYAFFTLHILPKDITNKTF